MSDKVRWAGIYLFFCLTPIGIHFLSSSNTEMMSDKLFTNFLVLVPYLGLFLIAILGWQVNQTRIFWSSLLLAAIYHFFIHASDFFSIPATRAAGIVIIETAYPLTLSILFVMKESQLWSDQSLTRVLLGTSPFLIFIGIYNWAPDLYQNLFPEGTESGFHLPWVTLLAYLLFLLIVVVESNSKAQSYLIALAVTSMPFLFCAQVCLWTNKPSTLSIENFNIMITLSVITGILLHAILRMYWQKVYLDILTEVPNRQALNERLETLQHPYALAMIDIDHFKNFNDSYGHAEGDNVLRMVALTLRESLGPRVYRYGGEEFCAVFTDLEAQKSHIVMEQARRSLEKRTFYLRQIERDKKNPTKTAHPRIEPKPEKAVHITISIGVAYSNPETQDHEDVIQAADKSLYQAKETGRNRVVSAP